MPVNSILIVLLLMLISCSSVTQSIKSTVITKKDLQETTEKNDKAYDVPGGYYNDLYDDELEGGDNIECHFIIDKYYKDKKYTPAFKVWLDDTQSGRSSMLELNELSDTVLGFEAGIVDDKNEGHFKWIGQWELGVISKGGIMYILSIKKILGGVLFMGGELGGQTYKRVLNIKNFSPDRYSVTVSGMAGEVECWL